MKWVILSGSPKGKYSITLQSVIYLQKHHLADQFTVFHVGQKIKKYEQGTVMDECIKAMLACDVIVFSYPVYLFLAPYQMARFIELLKKRDQAKQLAGKFATQITTSKHFYDTTAHRYIEENSADMGLKFISGLSADMDDLLSPTGRKQLKDFYKRVGFCIENDIYDIQTLPAGKRADFVYQSTLKKTDKKTGFDTVLVSDCDDSNDMLRGMIDAFKAAYPYPVREINIAKFHFAGGCLGCFRCAGDGHCVYRDGYENLLRNEIHTADAFVFAASIQDHSLGARFKCYDDRQFCNGHRIMTVGKTAGYILDGAITPERNLTDVIEARCDVGEMTLAGIATNESGSSGGTDRSIKNLAKSMAFVLSNGITQPQRFWGVGGMKIFRDLIYTMRGLMHADHKHYKKNGIYDFPQKRRGLILKMQLIGMLMRSKTLGKRAGNRMNEGMLAPYQKAMEKE